MIKITLTTDQADIITWALLKAYGDIDDAGCEYDAPIQNVRQAIYKLSIMIADERAKYF